MLSFVDEAVIEVASGRGGSGSVSFRREKYVPRGGPDGGDGGRGGDVIFIVKRNLKTLTDLKMKRVFNAEHGHAGVGLKKHGRDGKNTEIFVPPGTIIRDYESREILKDLKDDESWLYLSGGKGGKGNWHFRTSTRQAPRYAQPGLPGKQAKLLVELNLIADIGFVGLPNAGKSSLLKALTNANPKIAAYAFTTKIPNLGVLNLPEKDIILADIPGIIEGASQGSGLGIQFLKHINRTAGLAFMIDLTDADFLDRFPLLLDELRAFNPDLAEKPRIVIGTKMDLLEDDSQAQALQKTYPNETVLNISTFSNKNIEKLKREFLRLAH